MDQTNAMLENIKQSILVITQQAGVFIEKFWIILTKQQFLYGLQTFTKGIVGFLFGFMLAKWMDGVKKGKMAAWDKRAVLIVSFVGLLFLLFYSANMVVDSFPRLFNPEYYSIKEAVDMIQKVK